MSSHKSGYALFVNGKLDDYGCWEIDNDREPDWRKRIAYMADCVAQYCKANYVQHIYVEDVPPTIENFSNCQGTICITRHGDSHRCFSRY